MPLASFTSGVWSKAWIWFGIQQREQFTRFVVALGRRDEDRQLDRVSATRRDGTDCILFSQYYDTVRWMGDELARLPEFANMEIGLYAGSNRSGFWRAGRFQRCHRELLKSRVRSGELKLLLGTDAASEGLNLQRLGTLINIDLSSNPTRLEQRKGSGA